jgi:hypothetical protein
VIPLLPLLLAPPSAACEAPLELRTVQPRDGATGVPVNARIAVSFVGTGVAEAYEVQLLRGGAPVAAAAEAWCYEHEGPFELHCWWALRPEADLAPGAEHELQIRSTAAWTGEGSRAVTTRFTTGADRAAAPAGPPSLRVAEAWDEPAPDACAYPLARRFWLELLPAGGITEGQALSLYHIDALGPDGAPVGRVHSVLVTQPDGSAPDPLVKQFLDAADEPTDCFRVVQEGPAGDLSPPVEACFGDGDGGSPDSGTPDGGSADGGPADGRDTAGGAPDAPTDGAPSAEEEPARSKGSGCASSPSAPWAAAPALFGAMALLGRRRPRLGYAPRTAPEPPCAPPPPSCC